MSSKAVRDLVSAYLEANWGSTEIVGEENEFDEPPASLNPWLTYGFVAGPEDKLFIGTGTGCYKEEGQVILTVMVASGTGSDAALAYAESVRSMMRGLQPGSGLRFTTVDPPETSFPSCVQASQGNFFGYQVVAHYIYDYSV